LSAGESEGIAELCGGLRAASTAQPRQGLALGVRHAIFESIE